MEIRRLTEQDYDDFLTFHAQVYPSHLNVKDRFQFQFLGNPLLQDKTKTEIFFARDKEKKIIGQYSVNPVEYSFGASTRLGFCGCDLFVDQQARKYGVGGLLSMKAINSCKPHFSIGVSTEAKPLLLSLQMKKIGAVYRYIWIRNWSKIPLLIIQYLRQRKLKSCQLSRRESQEELTEESSPKQIDPVVFSSLISFNDYSFSLLSSKQSLTSLDQDYTPSNNKNRDYLTFARSPAFLQWRFFTKPGYGVYQLTKKSSSPGEREDFNRYYFAIRKISWKKLNLLAIVDLQADFSEQKMVQAMITATKRIAKENKCDGIITLSSYAGLDRALKKKLFVNVGHPFEIYTNVDILFSEDQIQRREAVHITMVDSDLEFPFWPKAGDD